ncbi:MAG: HXXEE domain-containing protein [Candidatus Eisenbacteria bacterium]|uniref:HXXEE domain-containing protein n=1 Tax=Eiseniibacteriota bacterium TaxID=2212470 RepID=A0A956NJ41_UNCEI|nr:HXXEE domain-containing protein [Candidatus Eisenbacteria bacterium]
MLDSRTPIGAASRSDFPPQAAWLLPIALLLHQLEEWFGGFPEWTRFVVGTGIAPERFILINAVALVLAVACTMVAFRTRSMGWMVVSLAALMGFNGILHGFASLLTGRYSPGSATGLILSLPLAVVVLRAARATLPKRLLVGAVAAGILLHGVVTLAALA